MLFSNTRVAKFLADNFECAWQELRPVPKVRIDFGNGHVLQRTLAGNVATWIVRDDGSSIDVIPALATVETYLARLKAAIALHDEVRNSKDPKAVLAAWHSTKSKPAAKRFQFAAAQQKLNGLAALQFLSKSGVERPIKTSLLPNDNEYNLLERAPRAHALLASNPGAPPKVLSYTLFKSVLNVDLADPYLGLAPYVLGGELGRH